MDALKNYKVLEVKGLFATVNFIFVLKHFTEATVVHRDEIDFGKYGIANKGATLVRLKIGDTKVAIVNCHLPSGWSQVDIDKRAAKSSEIMTWIGDENDVVIWGGDFNFRAYFNYNPSHNFGAKEIKVIMRNMRDHDELKLYNQNKIKAMGFKHPILNYLPSYRIDLKKKANDIVYSR